MYIFWRPFKNIKKSVEILDDNQLYVNCVIGAYVTLQKFLKKNPTFKNEPFQKFYWNNGKPALADIADYLYYSEKEWCNRGGEPYGTKKILEKVYNSKFAKERIIWKKTWCLNHFMILMNIDYFWYKRFYIELKNKQIKENVFFENNMPKGIKIKDLDIRDL